MVLGKCAFWVLTGALVLRGEEKERRILEVDRLLIVYTGIYLDRVERGYVLVQREDIHFLTFVLSSNECLVR